MSNITPSEESSNKPNISRTLPLEAQLNTTSRNSRGRVSFKDAILKTVALALFFYGGHLTIVSKQTEAGMAAIGTSVAIATAKQKDEEEQEQILNENKILNAYIQEKVNNYESIIEDLKNKNLSIEKDNARLEAHYIAMRDINELKLLNQELTLENKYLKQQSSSQLQSDNFLKNNQGDNEQGDNQ